MSIFLLNNATVNESVHMSLCVSETSLEVGLLGLRVNASSFSLNF